MARGYWLVKSDADYPWRQLVADGSTEWTGVRNYEARNHLRAMREGDLALYYHEKVVVGVARIVREAGPDPTADDAAWVSVEVAPLVPLVEPVALSTIKGDARLSDMQLVRRARLSVMPVTAEEFSTVLELGRTRLSRTRPARH